MDAYGRISRRVDVCIVSDTGFDGGPGSHLGWSSSLFPLFGHATGYPLENLQRALLGRLVHHVCLVTDPPHCYQLAIIASFLYQFKAITSGQSWPPPSTFVNNTERYSKGSLVVLVSFYTSLWAVKNSFLIFFKRLGQNVRWQKILWWCVFALSIATLLACIGNIQYRCLVSPLREIVSYCTNESALSFQQITLKLHTTIDVLTDVTSNARPHSWRSQSLTATVMSIPISLLWKKLALMSIFSLVIFTMVFAIVRAAVVSLFRRQLDATWLYMWRSIEQVAGRILHSGSQLTQETKMANKSLSFDPQQ